MKLFFAFIFVTLTVTAYSQDKYNYIHYNKFTEVHGTDYVYASIDNRSKMIGTTSQFLLY